jgi:hypothetical protein
MSIHIFWDNSNVWGGLSRLKEIKEPTVPWFALRAYFRNIYKLVEQGRATETKIMSGSVPPECEELWEYARGLGFQTDLLKRVESGYNTKIEQAVDEILHMKMANACLDFDPPQTMVLLSGDSADSDYDTSFPTQLRRALKHGWDVEVYSSSMSISKTKYKQLQDKYGTRLKVIYLDDYYYKITFIKEGEYYNKNPDGTRTYFHLDGRVVEQL